MFRGSDARTPTRQIRDAIDSDDPALVRRVFMKFPTELANDTPVIGCHLHTACRRGNLSVVQAMVEFGADINLPENRDGITAISDACAEGRVKIVRYLLSLGCELNVSSSIQNPLFACIASPLRRNLQFARDAGYSGGDEASARLAECADLLIDHGIDLTACYNQQSMVDMDASAFAYMFGQEAIGDAVIAALYGHDERLAASARAEALEVALGNAWSREKFRRHRRPPKRGKGAEVKSTPGEAWVYARP